MSSRQDTKAARVAAGSWWYTVSVAKNNILEIRAPGYLQIGVYLGRMKAARIIHDHHRTGWTPGNSVEEQEELEWKELLETLDVLLREGDIDESFLDDTTNSPRSARTSYEVGAVQDTCLDNSSRS
ncbi:hypothetical protein K438DRAFT_1930920 [Mycena galopus ATCC 62051]|nr:hypothetical protein K438DRAFT_1930920 [Mycena galopus ATCC 62051]